MKSKLEKSFAFKGFRKELTDQYGDRKGVDIWGYAVQELSKLMSIFNQLSKNGSISKG